MRFEPKLTSIDVRWMSFDLFFDEAAASRGLIFMNISSYASYVRVYWELHTVNAKTKRTLLFSVLIKQPGALVQIALRPLLDLGLRTSI